MANVPTLRTAVASAVIVTLVVKVLTWRRRTKHLPPGPPKVPLVDNLHNMPDGLDWVKFNELSKQYKSDVIHLSALGYSIVVLNTFEAAKELLDIRSGIYSSRPNSVMMHELCGMGDVLTLAPYGDHLRTSRRIFARHFGLGRANISRSREVFYARRCLHQLLETPDDFLKHLRHLVGALNLSITYGLKAQPSNDENIETAEEIVHVLTEVATAGIFMVDAIPVLKYLPKWFPGASFQSTAENLSTLMHRTQEKLFKLAKEVMETPDYTPSFISENLRELDQIKDALEVQRINDIAITVYLAGADTTTSALGTFMLAMVCYPEIQKKLQAELDAAVSGKLPDHDDIAQLPYLMATFMEVMRWKPVTPIGIPHSSTKVDFYNGYTIPEGSIVIPNQWAMLHDPMIYPEPSEFRPERFLKDGQIDKSVQNPLEVGFGFGRRICPGRQIAQSTFMIVAASILSTFDLRMKKDPNGEPMRPTQEYNLSLVSYPKEFPCDIVPRSSEAKDLIVSWAVAEGDNPP